MIIKTNDNNLLIDIFNRDGNVVLKIKYGNFISESFILMGSIQQLHGFTNAMVNNPEHIKEINKHNNLESENLSAAPLVTTLNLIESFISENQTLKDELENIRTNYEYQKQGYDKALSDLEKTKQENERLKTDNKTANSNYNTWADNAKKEIAGLKSDVKTAESNYDKLKSENEEYKEYLDKLVELLQAIPNSIEEVDGERSVNFGAITHFIKNALAKENRIDGKLYAAKFHNAFEPTAIKWDDVGKFWHWYGNDIQYTDSFFEWISDTPINLEYAI